MITSNRFDLLSTGIADAEEEGVSVACFSPNNFSSSSRCQETYKSRSYRTRVYSEESDVEGKCPPSASTTNQKRHVLIEQGFFTPPSLLQKLLK